ncbi:PREDICTED: uncharacterized protein LOC104601500 [Nelumbo nucifera]|uniref:Uncharacterized protein LOC104601500 n=1 Tax=Nelumbo nucifera TaxID=4432 RepID=A0A1U8A916_NELNU|nr:PREDICTED: uncharacterized protein LOC104601500 [Nelumbo nucifera]
MKIVSWNVRGLGNARKRALIKEVLRKENPDIFLIQESKLMTIDKRWVRSVWRANGLSWVMSPSWGSSGGIVTLWKDEVLEGVEELMGRFSVSIKFKQVTNEFEWVLTNVYGPTGYKQRNDLWDELEDIRGWEEHWGDLVSRALPRVTSDHWPIMLSKADFGNSGPSPFRFENMWLLHLDFKEKVKQWWNEINPRANWAGMKFHWKLKELKVKIKEWNILHLWEDRRKEATVDKPDQGISCKGRTRMFWGKGQRGEVGVEEKSGGYNF